MPTRKSRPAAAEHPALAAIRKEGHAKVKVAVSRHRRHPARQVAAQSTSSASANPRAASASATSCTAGTCTTSATTTRRSPAGSKGYPRRARAARPLDRAPRAVGRRRAVLPRRLRAHGRRFEEPFPLCPRQLLKRVLARAASWACRPMCGLEFEWFNFAETPQSWAAKRGVAPEPITPGMFGYSLLRMADQRATSSTR
jgi:glutamine synthetase